MKKLASYLIVIVISVATGWFLCSFLGSIKTQVVTLNLPKPRPLDRYTIENLSKAEIKPAAIKIEKTLEENKDFTAYLFSMSFDPTLEGKNFKKMTGMINIPKGNGPFPLVVMIRGYVDQKAYQTGDGTRRAGEFFAQNGFITIAPDFLGYGESDSEAGDIFESRFQTYTTILSLLKYLEKDSELKLEIGNWKLENLFIWAHSNGGQIALTTLEITGASYPTVLWAPVSKPFPYSVLYYTDEADDGGKLIRRELAKFEEDYDTDLYSLTKFLDRIKAPLQIHQGTADDAVPVAWTDSLVKILKNQENQVEYYKYPGADHNLTPGWNQAITRGLSFFKQFGS
jgi:dienelactone hydrolase